MERIRYSKKEDGSLVSVQTFQHPSNGASYKSIIEGTGWKIEDTHTKLIADQRVSIIRAISKKEVREALIKLGIVLSTEKRAPRKPKV